MHPTSGPPSFKGTLHFVWKANRPCRIYVTDGQVYFIRRVVAMNPGAAAVLGSQFGLIGGLAAGLAAKAKASPDFVRDDDATPPDQLLSKHADNYVVPVSAIVDSRFEPEGKFMTYGKNAGQWHFTRRGDEKETVVLLESAADASQAGFLLGEVLGSGPRREAGVAKAVSGPDLVTSLPLPAEQADVVEAMASLTQLLGERAPAAWQKLRCEVRLAPSSSPRPLEIIIFEGDRLAGRPDSDPAIEQAALRLARKLTASVRTFPGLVIEMTRLDEGGWRNHVRLMDKK